MTNYTITTNLIPGLPQEPYRNGVGAYEGVVLHSTAVYDDTAQAERSYESRTWNTAFVHAFCDDTTILQTADFNYISWHAAQTANHLTVGIELCQSHDAQKFASAYDRWVWLAAKLLHDKKLGVVDGVTLMSHAQVSQKWKQCDHDDPAGMDGKSGYLATHNKTWADVVADVTAKYNEMEQPVVMPTLRLWNHNAAVKVLQHHLNILVDGVFGPITLMHVKSFQRTHGLVDDGVVGPLSWAKLLG